MTLDAYQRVGVVVQTATTTIWKGFDPALQREVALKELTGRDAAEAARREATALAGLKHPNIVSVYDVLDDDGVWLVEQWITGAPLAAVVAHIGRLRAIDALALVHGALTGLAYAHGRDVVHGDIAPANILIDKAGTPMLVDFGLAVAPGHTSLGGTPGYMAPEAAAGETVDKRSDVYSTCVVLAELLTGARLFTGSVLTIAQAQDATPQLAGIEAPVAAVLTVGLDPQPDARPADAATLLAQLDDAAEKTHGKGWLALAGLGAIGSTAATIGAGVTLSGTSTVAGGTAATAASAASRRKLLAAAGAGVAVVAAVLAFLLLRPEPPEPTTASAPTTTSEPAAAPVPSAPEGPVLRGRYDYVGEARGFTVNVVQTFASDCPTCDVTMSSQGITATYSWNGNGWEVNHGGGCGPMLDVITPTAVDAGLVQTFTLARTYLAPTAGCTLTSGQLGTGTRIGD